MVAIAHADVPFAIVVEQTLARVLRRATADLIEPRITDPQRALKVLECLVETIAGFAIGTIAGEVFGGVRTWFGDDGLAALRTALGAAWPEACRKGGRIESAYLDDASARPLVDELASTLHVRFCGMSRDVRALIDCVETTIEHHAPTKRGVVGVMFGLLAKEENLEKRLAAELTFGWSMYTAVIAGRALPSTERRSARSQALWLAWQHQLLGRPVLTRSEHEQAGYIMLVA